MALEKALSKSENSTKNMNLFIFTLLTRVTSFYSHITISFLPFDSITAIAITSDNQQLISGSSDYTIKLWDISSKQCLHKFEALGIIIPISSFLKIPSFFSHWISLLYRDHISRSAYYQWILWRPHPSLGSQRKEMSPQLWKSSFW